MPLYAGQSQQAAQAGAQKEQDGRDGDYGETRVFKDQIVFTLALVLIENTERLR